MLSALLCFALGMLFAKIETWRAGTKLLGGEISTRLTGRVAVIEHQANGRIRLTMDVLATERPKLKYVPDRVRVSARAIPENLQAGEVVVGIARLAPPSGPTRPGSYDFSFESYFDGIGANGFFLKQPERAAGARADEDAAQFLALVENLRTDLANRIRGAIGGAEGEIAAALIAGVRAGIPEDVNEALRRTGLAHVLSISGLHMALVAATIMVVLRAGFALFPGFASRRPVKKYAAGAGLVALAVYLFISGSAVAAERSFLMFGVMLLAVIFDRAALTMRNLAIAAIVIIAVSPHEVAGPSFQMSFAATAALIGAYAAWAERRRPASAANADRGMVGKIAGKAGGYAVGLAMTSLIAGTGDGGIRRLSLSACLDARAGRQSRGDADRFGGRHAVCADRHGPDAVRPRPMGLRGDGQGPDGDDRGRRVVFRAVADRRRRTNSSQRRRSAHRRADHCHSADDLAAAGRSADRAGGLLMMCDANPARRLDIGRWQAGRGADGRGHDRRQPDAAERLHDAKIGSAH